MLQNVVIFCPEVHTEQSVEYPIFSRKRLA